MPQSCAGLGTSEEGKVRGMSQYPFGYCWRIPRSRKFHPVYSFFEPRELGKACAEKSALGIEIGSPTVSIRFMIQGKRYKGSQGASLITERTLLAVGWNTLLDAPNLAIISVTYVAS
jgi:hypothetical protein